MGNLGSADSEPVEVDWQWQHYLPSLAMFLVGAAILFAIWQVFHGSPR
jgi:hypothetical protein